MPPSPTIDPIDLDRIAGADPSQVSSCAIAIGDVIQNYPMHIRVLGVATFVKLFFAQLKLSPQDLMTWAGNLLDRASRAQDKSVLGLKAWFQADF